MSNLLAFLHAHRDDPRFRSFVASCLRLPLDLGREVAGQSAEVIEAAAARMMMAAFAELQRLLHDLQNTAAAAPGTSPAAAAANTKTTGTE